VRPDSRKSHSAQAICKAAIQQGYRVLYQETISYSMNSPMPPPIGTPKEHTESPVWVTLLIIDDFGMRSENLPNRLANIEWKTAAKTRSLFHRSRGAQAAPGSSLAPRIPHHKGELAAKAAMPGRHGSFLTNSRRRDQHEGQSGGCYGSTQLGIVARRS
jgi:hypothetical protein